MNFSSAAESVAAAIKQRRLLRLNSAAGKTTPLCLPAYTKEKPARALSPFWSSPPRPGPTIKVPELVLPEQSQEKLVTLPLLEELKVVLVFREAGSTAPWFPPPPQIFQPDSTRFSAQSYQKKRGAPRLCHGAPCGTMWGSWAFILRTGASLTPLGVSYLKFGGMVENIILSRFLLCPPQTS